VQRHHDHPRDPEEDDVETGHENRGGEKALQIGVSSGQPSEVNGTSAEENQVEHVVVALERAAMAFGGSFFLGFFSLRPT